MASADATFAPIAIKNITIKTSTFFMLLSPYSFFLGLHSSGKSATPGLHCSRVIENPYNRRTIRAYFRLLKKVYISIVFKWKPNLNILGFPDFPFVPFFPFPNEIGGSIARALPLQEVKMGIIRNLIGA